MRLSLGIRTLMLMAVIFGTGLLARTSGTFGTPAVHAAGTTTVTVHYYRPKGDYGDLTNIDKSWNVWLWGAQPASAVTDAPGAGYTFQGTDAFGAVGTFTVPAAATQLGIIIRYCQWNETCNQKDVAQDRFVNTPNGSAEV